MKLTLIILGLLVVLAAAGGASYLAMRAHVAPVPAEQTSTSAAAAMPQDLQIFATSSASAPAPSNAPAQVPAGTYSNVVLKLGDTGHFYGTLALTPMAVTQDSRCPVDVECIQAGTVTLDFDAAVNGTVTHHTLSLGQSVTLGGHQVTFKAAAPQKHAGIAIQPSAYRFTFSVE